MRVFLCGMLLLPLSAALTGLECVHKCLTDPLVAMLPSEEEIRSLAQRGIAGDYVLSRELLNMTGIEAACFVLTEVVPCLEECEPSNQQEYFQRALDAVHAMVCSTPTSFMEHAAPLLAEGMRCYEWQLLDDYAISAIGALMVSGGVDGADASTNLCYLASSVARALVNNRCNNDVKLVVVSGVEFLYRLSALKLGIANVTTTDQPAFYGTCQDFRDFIYEGAPLSQLIQDNVWHEVGAMSRGTFAKTYVETSTKCMQGCLRDHAISLLSDERTFANPCESIHPFMECFKRCPSNKLQKAANSTYNLACNGSIEAIFEQCPIKADETMFDGEYGLTVLKRMITSGANSWMDAGHNLCHIYSSFFDPPVIEFESRLAEIDDPLAKHNCKIARNTAVDMVSIPLRLALLKLGIPEEEFHCGPY